ncbi:MULTISPECIES: sulfate ABC transporter permease subunit CysW [unclassified Synechococcus]|jgi:sulfate transport system permease protein|uniref:sulfate ABC transporter permease subunit CysW n=1 Tax=unclassified Synechococcus TaxID=2626047 RepID=UPI000069406D|nr:sulfate ABC transporter permease subunit CysW [Synechococcus sp. JA-3-3Ab]ABC98686.1 sulfate ABC transporter, permease protein CysW [Synechococcus sp. JA-3-3Ab]
MRPKGVAEVQGKPPANPWLAGLLIGIVLLYVGLLIGIPLVNVFYQALREGIPSFFQHLGEREFLSAARLTLLTALVVVPLNTLFGLCAAIALARRRFPGRALLLSLIDLPFSISPVVAGLMLVLIFGRQGWLGSWNLRVIFAFPGIVLATAFITLPFVVREVLPVLEEAGTEEEEAAKTLGANSWQVFWRITLPNIRWGLLYGVILTNARAMGEFGAVAVVSGNIVGRTQTLPLFVEDAYRSYATGSAYAAAVVLSLLAVVTLVARELLERGSPSRRIF